MKEFSVKRIENPKPEFTPISSMFVEAGNKEDYHRLHHLHYKSEGNVAGPSYWRCVDEKGNLIGIVVMSTPNLMLSVRHKIFPNLSPGKSGKETTFSNTYRGKWLNANMRRAARIVTDTMFRGVGVSYRMVNIACRMQQKKFVEIRSSMSKFNPFDVKAGFVHANLEHPRMYEQGFDFFRGLYESHPADHKAIMEEHNALPERVREKYEEEVKRFYFRFSSRERVSSAVYEDRVQGLSFSHALKEAQQLVFASPVYGIWQNPDLGVKLPERIPLSAFDLQRPNEPLRIDLL